MCEVGRACSFGWYGDLPEGCPPTEAVNPADGQFAYRLTSDPIHPDDFLSQFELTTGAGLNPEIHFQEIGVSQCLAKSLSLWETFEKGAKAARSTLLRQQGRTTPRKVLFAAGCGVLQPNRKGHVSWWRCAGYDPILHTEGAE